MNSCSISLWLNDVGSFTNCTFGNISTTMRFNLNGVIVELRNLTRQELLTVTSTKIENKYIAGGKYRSTWSVFLDTKLSEIATLVCEDDETEVLIKLKVDTEWLISCFRDLLLVVEFIDKHSELKIDVLKEEVGKLKLNKCIFCL